MKFIENKISRSLHKLLSEKKCDDIVQIDGRYYKVIEYIEDYRDDDGIIFEMIVNLIDSERNFSLTFCFNNDKLKTYSKDQSLDFVEVYLKEVTVKKWVKLVKK